MNITQSPPKFSPAYNELVYVVQSDNESLPNYKYICDIYAADGTTRIARLKRIPQPDGYGLFDLHRILENYVSYDIDASTAGFAPNTKNGYSYIVKFGEEYGSGPSGPVLYPALVTGSKKYIYNAIFDFPDFIGYDQTDWLIAAATQKKFLTHSPRNLPVRPGTNAWLYFMTDTNIVSQLVLKTHDSANNLLNTVGLFNSCTDMSHDENRFLRVPAGPANAGTAFSTTLDETIHHYTLQLVDSDNHPISETFLFTINNDCNRYAWYRLHFLNKMGGFDSFDFKQQSHINLDINRSSYKKYTGTETAGTWSYASMDRGHAQYDTVIREKTSVSSDWISDTEAAWLEEMFTSPAVYLERADNSLVAINIETSSYEIKQKANDKLISIGLEFTYAYDKYRQRQ